MLSLSSFAAGATDGITAGFVPEEIPQNLTERLVWLRTSSVEGDKIVLDVVVTEFDEAVTGIAISLTYPPALSSFVGCSDGELFPPGPCFFAETVPPGKVFVARTVLGVDQATPVVGDQVIVRLEFSVFAVDTGPIVFEGENLGGGDASAVLDTNGDPIFVDWFAGELRGEQAVISAEIDITPSINPYNRGVIPVAILGSDTFDVADVDVTSLAFGPNEARTAHNLSDTFTYNDHIQNVNLDGFTDLVTHYRTHDTGIVCGNESVTLTGATVPIPAGGFAPSNPSPSANTVSLDGDATGDIVSLDVLVTGTADVYGFLSNVVYDPTKAEFVGWSEGELLESDVHQVAYLLNADEAGRVVVAISRLGPVPGVDVGVTAKLVTLDLRVTEVGTSQVGFENAYLFNSQAGVIGGITFDGGTLLNQTATLFEGTDSIQTVGCRGGRRSLFDRPGEDRLIQSRGGDATTPQRK
jgi:hypothetical protein